MRQLVSLVIVAIYSLGLGLSDPLKPFAPYLNIQMEHSHVVTGSVHHHYEATGLEHEDGNDEHSDQDDIQNDSDEHKESTSHTHTVSISMSSTYTAGTSPLVTELIRSLPQSAPLTICEDTPPEDLTLRSIFRPPIA